MILHRLPDAVAVVSIVVAVSIRLFSPIRRSPALAALTARVRRRFLFRIGTLLLCTFCRGKRVVYVACDRFRSARRVVYRRRWFVRVGDVVLGAFVGVGPRRSRRHAERRLSARRRLRRRRRGNALKLQI